MLTANNGEKETWERDKIKIYIVLVTKNVQQRLFTIISQKKNNPSIITQIEQQRNHCLSLLVDKSILNVRKYTLV